ncbi:hypothetical protein CWI38_0332p0030 [Hamiltosporidium tvaerminnensis]|uniref:Uncharacterized protein n=1 Tax=Hamiltosporidium tvaerminnensis TaxID=1176355 RepID=A0A4Q9M134_9MICR|nr:hypothetical protein CWI38_0332p0030 [Hamiltosporidium tvaerminnensis]
MNLLFLSLILLFCLSKASNLANPLDIDTSGTRNAMNNCKESNKSKDIETEECLNVILSNIPFFTISFVLFCAPKFGNFYNLFSEFFLRKYNALLNDFYCFTAFTEYDLYYSTTKSILRYFRRWIINEAIDSKVFDGNENNILNEILMKDDIFEKYLEEVVQEKREILKWLENMQIFYYKEDYLEILRNSLHCIEFSRFIRTESLLIFKEIFILLFVINNSSISILSQECPPECNDFKVKENYFINILRRSYNRNKWKSLKIFQKREICERIDSNTLILITGLDVMCKIFSDKMDPNNLNKNTFSRICYLKGTVYPTLFRSNEIKMYLPHEYDQNFIEYLQKFLSKSESKIIFVTLFFSYTDFIVACFLKEILSKFGEKEFYDFFTSDAVKTNEYMKNKAFNDTIHEISTKTSIYEEITTYFIHLSQSMKTQLFLKVSIIKNEEINFLKIFDDILPSIMSWNLRNNIRNDVFNSKMTTVFLYSLRCCIKQSIKRIRVPQCSSA